MVANDWIRDRITIDRDHFTIVRYAWPHSVARRRERERKAVSVMNFFAVALSACNAKEEPRTERR